MKTTINLILFLALAWNTANAQVGIGITDPKDDAALEVESTTKGFLPPRMTGAERDAITSPAQGLVIYNTDTDCVQWYNGTAWYDRCEGGLTPGPLSDCPTIVPFLPADETIVKDVTNPVTGDTWMDRNLGAYNEARSSTDCWSFGNYYQWGRASDGHEYASSGQTSTIATTALPNAENTWDGLFILTNSNPNNWLSSIDNTLWQGVSAANNPCPAGYRVPSQAELNNERSSWSSNNAAGAYASLLNLTMAGQRNRASGDLENDGTNGTYWSTTISTVSSGNITLLVFDSSDAQINQNGSTRAFGRSVRCIKE